jgi:hypothetical protein
MTDDPTVITVKAVGIEEYDDIVAWLVTGSVMMEAADAELGNVSFISRGMQIAAARIVELQTTLEEAIADAKEWKRRATRNEQ